MTPKHIPLRGTTSYMPLLKINAKEIYVAGKHIVYAALNNAVNSTKVKAKAKKMKRKTRTKEKRTHLNPSRIFPHSVLRGFFFFAFAGRIGWDGWDV
jgi:hypothetical protein